MGHDPGGFRALSVWSMRNYTCVADPGGQRCCAGARGLLCHAALASLSCFEDKLNGWMPADACSAEENAERRPDAGP